MISLKRKRQPTSESGNPNDSYNEDQEEEAVASNVVQAPETPSKKRRGRPPGSVTKPRSTTNTPLKKATTNSTPKGKRLFETPSKFKPGSSIGTENEVGIPIVRNADRSARRKSARTLIDQTLTLDDDQDDQGVDEEDTLAKRIWDADEGDEEDDAVRGSSDEGDFVPDPAVPVTPSKRGRKGPRRKRTPTPPQDLPPHERYFFQNRAGNTKTSNNTFSSLSLLSHEQYHKQINGYRDPHASSYAFLHSLHSRSFPQWRFELSQSFNICLYGYGSKRHLTASFASYLHSHHHPTTTPKIVVANGYIPTLTIRQILTTIACTIHNCPSPSSLPVKLPAQPQQILDTILHELFSSPPPSPIYLLVNSLDAPPLRRAPTPSLLAQLASSPYVRLLATCDTPNFPLLWDTNLREQYNWLFHDATTYISYGGVEIEDVVEEVNELMGRSGRRIKGKEGVGFVLRSLPENARALYRVLVGELLTQGAEGLDGEGMLDDEEENIEEGGGLLGTSHKLKKGRGRVGEVGGIEYRTLYQKVVEEFICSNEMGFRQLLKEFHDHQMIVSRRDVTGAEMLTVPFRKDEMEAILEDLVL
ncbi:MAG: hypothetical protein Q9185_001704 [Variospora sp. 1 TL-2023]